MDILSMRLVRPELLGLLLSFGPLVHAQSKGGRWQCENNGLDTAGWDVAEDHGVLQDPANYGNFAPLREGSAYLSVEAGNAHDFLKIEDSADLDFDNENIGISAWIYPIAFTRVHFLIVKGDQFPTPKTTNYCLRISESKNLEFLIRDANDRAQRVTSSFEIPLDQWTFVAAFYDFQAQKVYLWNDPAAPAADTLHFNQPFFSNDAPLAIGTWYRSDPGSPSINDFEGRIDDVRLSGRWQDLFPPTTSVAFRTNPAAATLPAELHVFPNPAVASGERDHLAVHFTSQFAQVNSIAIYNVLGETVFETATFPSAQPFHFEWSLRDQNGHLLRTGIYWIRINNGRSYLTKKFFVMR
ncbi:MAG: LamG-like jellyroll fold domain-containing protein [bacterium]